MINTAKEPTTGVNCDKARPGEVIVGQVTSVKNWVKMTRIGQRDKSQTQGRTAHATLNLLPLPNNPPVIQLRRDRSAVSENESWSTESATNNAHLY